MASCPAARRARPRARAEKSRNLDLHHALVGRIDRPHGDIDMVHAPVRQWPATCFQPHPPAPVATLRAVPGLGRRPQPPIPIQPLGHFHEGKNVAPFPVPGRQFHRRDQPRTEPAQPRQGDRLEENPVVLAALLRPHLHDAPASPDNAANGLAIRHGQGHRLLHVDVLPRPDGVHDHLGVPMVRRPDGHRIDIVARQRLAIVPVHLRPLRLHPVQLGTESLHARGVHIAAGHDPPERATAHRYRAAAAPHADGEKACAVAPGSPTPRPARKPRDAGGSSHHTQERPPPHRAPTFHHGSHMPKTPLA